MVTRTPKEMHGQINIIINNKCENSPAVKAFQSILCFCKIGFFNVNKPFFVGRSLKSAQVLKFSRTLFKTHLRTLLCKNQTKWEMKIFDPLSKLACKEIFRGDVPKLPLLTSLLHCYHGNISCLLAPQNPILNSEPTVKSAKCKTPFLKSINTLQLKTYTKVKTICGFMFNHL